MRVQTHGRKSMNRMRIALFHRIVPASFVAVLLLCTPPQLTAQERELRAADQATTIDWLTSLWNDLTTWLAGEVIPVPKPTPSSDIDGGGCLDPHGGCGG